MQIAILHGAVADDAPPDEQDTLAEVEAVAQALNELGHDTRALPVTLDLGAMRADLVADRPDLIMNLVESLAGRGRYLPLPAQVWEELGIPYAGAPADALHLTSHKLLGKAWLRAAGLPTPDWRTADAPGDARRWIVKSVWEHASIGIDAGSIVVGDGIAARMAASRARLGGEWFAEEFIDGREFNLSVLGGPGGPEVLPLAEILFQDFAPDAPRIVDYAAKWDAASHAYHHTPRRFDFTDRDPPLLDRLRELALACWRAFDLRGWARVDFRVDVQGRPWVLEVNTNPCIAPDAGFAAAAERAGINYTEAVSRIVQDGLIGPGQPA